MTSARLMPSRRTRLRLRAATFWERIAIVLAIRRAMLPAYGRLAPDHADMLAQCTTSWSAFSVGERCCFMATCAFWIVGFGCAATCAAAVFLAGAALITTRGARETASE